MTIASTTSKVSYNGSGSTGPFPITYKFTKNADITATKRSSLGVETVLALTTDYTLTGAGDAAGGALTLTVALAVGESLVIARAPRIVQEVDYVENSAFPAETHESALDLLTTICQSLQEQIDRSIKVNISSPTSPDDLLEEIATDVAGAAAAATAAQAAQGLAEDARDATIAAAASVPTFGAFGLTLAATTTASNARTALGLGSAALLDAGTDPGDVVQLDASAQLPAVSGALLTDLSALAKFATVANRVLYINSAGEPMWLALGAAGTVLQSNGASVAPTFEEAAGGMWERVSKTVVSTSVVSVAFTGLNFTVYDYKIHVCNAVSTELRWRIGIGSTPTYITTGYRYTKEANNDYSATVPSDYVLLPVRPVANLPNMSDLVVSSTSTHVIGDATQSSGDTTCFFGRGVGYTSLTGIATAVQFGAGVNITAGTFTLYRRKK